MKFKIVSLFFGMLMLLPLVFAQGFGFGSPFPFLDSPMFMFIIVFLVFFAIIYYAVQKSFDNNVVSGVIAIGTSLLITLTLTRRGLLFGYFGQGIGSWMLIAGAIIAFGFLFKIMTESLGKFGAVLAIGGLWFFIQTIDPYSMFPHGLQRGDVIYLFEVLQSIWGLFILLGLGLVVSTFFKKDPLEAGINKFRRKYFR